MLNPCQTLDDLHSSLLKESYVLSLQALYLRLIPSLRNGYEDANFCFSTKQYMKDTAPLFGAENVFVLSVDGEEKVPIGVTAATKQSSLVMHVD